MARVVVRSRWHVHRRDQSPSTFAPILGRLCDASGVLGAVFVDRDGEAVDYAGRVDPFEIRVAAAEWRIVLARVHRGESVLAATDQLVMRAAEKTFATVALPEGYALVVQLAAHCFGVSPRALAEAVRELCVEAGLPKPRQRADWARIQVTEDPNRPKTPQMVWMDRGWHPVELLSTSSVADSTTERRERSFEVSLPGGQKATLTREPLAQWFGRPSHLFQ